MSEADQANRPREYLIFEPCDSDLAEGMMNKIAYEKHELIVSAWNRRIKTNMHVIEYSAYESLKLENERLVKQLEIVRKVLIQIDIGVSFPSVAAENALAAIDAMEKLG